VPSLDVPLLYLVTNLVYRQQIVLRLSMFHATFAAKISVIVSVIDIVHFVHNFTKIVKLVIHGAEIGIEKQSWILTLTFVQMLCF